MPEGPPTSLTPEEMDSFQQQAGPPQSMTVEQMSQQTMPEPVRQQYTPLESGTMGTIQGATFDLADEGEGAVKALYDVATGPEELKDLLNVYQKRRDQARKRYGEARQDNPKSYIGGQVAGSVATGFVPGLGWMNAAKGAKLGTTLGKAGISGGLGGAGASEAEVLEGDVGGLAEDIGEGMAYGAGTAGTLKGLGAGVKALNPRNLVKKGANVVLNTPEELTELRLDRGKDAILNAPKRHELVGKYKDILGKLKTKTIEGSKESRKELKGLTIKGSEISDRAKKITDYLKDRAEGVDDDEGRIAAAKYLQGMQKKYGPKAQKQPEASGLLDQYGAPIRQKKLPPIDTEYSGSRIKDTIQSVGKNVDYEISAGKFGKIDQGIQKEFRREIDGLLKSKSPAYAESMKQVKKDTDLLDKASNIGTEKTLANVFRRIETDEFGAGQFPREIIEQVDARMGTDLLDQVKLSYAREAFDKSITQGSMNVNKFRNLIEGLPFIGRLAGFLGSIVDKYGRQVTMGAIDGVGYLETVYKKSGAKGFAEAAKPLITEAAKGNIPAAVALEMMHRNHPELNKGQK